MSEQLHPPLAFHERVVAPHCATEAMAAPPFVKAGAHTPSGRKTSYAKVATPAESSGKALNLVL
jgi:hypothetical protein